jgi:hypothetical protein
MILPSGLSIMAGGPLRARPRPALRYGPKARTVFAIPFSPCRVGRKPCARTYALPRPSCRPTSPVPERQKEQAATATHRKEPQCPNPR